MRPRAVSDKNRRDGHKPAEFTLPQFGIFAQGTHAHRFLAFDLKPGVTYEEALAAFRRLRTPDVSAGGVNLVLAFGAPSRRAPPRPISVRSNASSGQTAITRRRSSTTRGCGSAVPNRT